jgi:hypothetical protein
MFQRIRHSTFVKFLWAFMGLYFLNISVDTADANPNYIAEDLSFNDQESIVEIVVEKILGFENAIEEQDDPDTENHTKKSNFNIDFFSIQTSYRKLTKSISIHLKQTCYQPDSHACMGHYQLNNPPPEV